MKFRLVEDTTATPNGLLDKQSSDSIKDLANRAQSDKKALDELSALIKLKKLQADPTTSTLLQNIEKKS